MNGVPTINLLESCGVIAGAKGCANDNPTREQELFERVIAREAIGELDDW